MELSRTTSSKFQEAQETFKGGDDVAIFTRSWHPADQARAVVVIAHGFNSHSGQYAWVAEQLVAKGFAVYAMDHRGRGQSGGERFHVAHFSDYVDDLATFIRLAKSREPELPAFLLGHSAGGVISALYALDHQSELAGLNSDSFAFEIPAPGFALAALKGLSRLAPHLHVLKLKNADFSRDPTAVAAMNRDPLIAGESETAQAAAELIRADAYLRTQLPRITLPLLILHGTADKAAKPSGSQFFYATAGAKDKTLKLYDGAFHDLLNDTIRTVAMADIGNWLEDRLSTKHKPDSVSAVSAIS